MTDEFSTLDRYNQLGKQSAKITAKALTDLTGSPTRARITDVRLLEMTSLRARYQNGEYVAIHVNFHGNLEGTAAILLSSSDADMILEAIGAGENHTQSGLETVGNIIASKYVDVLANEFSVAIKQSPPEVIRGEASGVIPDAGDDTRWVLTLASQLELVEEILSLDVVLLPDQRTLFANFSADNGETNALERVIRIGRLARDGTQRATDHMGMLTGLDAALSISRIRFAAIESIPRVAESGVAIGTIFYLEDTPGGYVALLFDEAAATRVATAMMPGDSEIEEDWSGMGRSAIEELGNVVTSGFIDGWADALEGTIGHSPPEFIVDDRVAILSSLGGRLSVDHPSAVVIDASIALDGGDISCELHALPEKPALASTIDSLLDTEDI